MKKVCIWVVIFIGLSVLYGASVNLLEQLIADTKKDIAEIEKNISNLEKNNDPLLFLEKKRLEILKSKLASFESRKEYLQKAQTTLQDAVSQKIDSSFLNHLEEILTTKDGRHVLDDLWNKIVSGGKVTEEDIALKFKPTYRNSLDIKVGPEFWDYLVEDIKKAKKFIHIHIFGMQADNWGWELAHLLAQKSREGVKIRIVADQMGARMVATGIAKVVGKIKNKIKGRKPVKYKYPKDEKLLFKFYRDNGVEVVFYNRAARLKEAGRFLRMLVDFYHFDHRKYFIIDGKVAYNGGYTMEQHMRHEMHDTMVRAEGDLVYQMEASFLLNFLYNGGKLDYKDKMEFISEFFPPHQITSRMEAELLINVPRQQHQVTESYLEEMDKAKKYLYVINPYFTYNKIVDGLKRAAQRGVDVRAILPGKPENVINNMNVDYHVQELLKAGVKVYRYWGEEKLGRLHAKGMIRDDEFVSVGSCNMDKMALRHNFEQNVVSRDPDFVRYVRKKLYEHDFKYSELAKPIENFKDKVLNKIKGLATEPLDQFD